MRGRALLALLVLAGCPDASSPSPDDAGSAPPPPAEVSLLFGETTRGVVDGVGRGARFDSVTCLELSPDGETLYASDTFVGTLRVIDVDTREVRTLVGVPFETSLADGTGDEVRLGEPRGLGLTPDGGRLYFADGPVLRSLELQSRDVTSHVGIASEPGYVDGDFVSARLGFLQHDLEVDEGGARVFLADRSNDVVRVFFPEDESVETFAGPFDGPGGLSRDGDTLYVADTFAGALRALSLTTAEVSLVVDGLAAPQGVGFDGQDALYALGFNGALRKLTLSTGALSTVATSEPLSGSFASLVIDRARQRLYFPDLDTSAIRVVELASGQVSTLAGPESPAGLRDGSLEEARFGWIYGLAASDDGALVYVADPENSAVRKVNVASGVVETLPYDGWDSPVGVALDDAGERLFVTDAATGAVSVVSLDDGAVATVAEGLSTPWGIVYVDGALFVTELDAGRVARLDALSGQSEAFADGFSAPLALAHDEDALYLSDVGAGRVYRASFSGEEPLMLADGLPSPAGVVVHEGLLFVAVTEDHTVRRINLAGSNPTVVLGRVGISAAIGTAPVPADVATLTLPEAMTLTPAGLLVSVEYGVYLVPLDAVR